MLEPVVGELHAILGAAEILDFHLLKLPGAEDVVAGVDLVAKGFSDLRDAKGQFLASCIEHIAKIHKDRLSGLGTQVNHVIFRLKGPGMAFEHQVEIPGFGEITTAAGGTVFLAVLDGQLICAVARIAFFAIHHRIAECLLVTRCLPDRAIHDDRAVHTLHVIPLTDVPAPPEIFQVLFQFDA